MCNVNLYMYKDKLMSVLQSSVGASTVDNKRHKSQICICLRLIFVKQLNPMTNVSQIPQFPDRMKLHLLPHKPHLYNKTHWYIYSHFDLDQEQYTQYSTVLICPKI